MSFKVVFREETKRVPTVPASFSALKEAISKAFGSKIPSETVTKYIDLDGDLITVNSDDDYKVMVDLLKNQIKVFVLPHDATSTSELMRSSQITKTSEKKPSDDIMLLDSPKSEAAKSVEIPVKTAEKVAEKNPKRLAVEEEIRKKFEKKAEEKAKRKIELKKAKRAMFEAMGQLMSKSRELLEVKTQLLECKKRANELDEPKSEVNCEFDEEKMDLKVQKEVLLLEIKDLQVTVEDLKKTVKTFKGKKHKKPACHGARKVQFEVKPAVIHPRVTCDGCGVHPMVGVRYKCTICHDFDFCEKCEATKPHPHAWIKIDHPSKAPKFLFAIDAQPEYVNDLSVSGDKGLANLLSGMEPVLNQFLSPEEVQQKLQEIKREIAPESPVEVTETVDTEVKVTEVTEEQVMKPVSEEKSEPQPEEVIAVPVEAVEVEEKPADPIEVRVKFLNEIFSDIAVEQMTEIVKSNEFKTDEEIINQLLSRWN